MSWFIAIFIFSLYAKPPDGEYKAPEKTEDVSQCSDLDATCTSQPQKVVEQEADRDPDAEKRCTDKELFKNPTERESCRHVEARNRRARAEQRERAEAEVGALVDTKKPVCAYEDVKANCETFYISAIKDKDRSEEKIKSCENECSVSSFSVKKQLMSCTSKEKSDASEYLTTRRKYCGTSGFAAADGSESGDDGSKALSPEEQIAYGKAQAALAREGGGGTVFRVDDLKGEGPGYCVTSTKGSVPHRNCQLVSGREFNYKVTDEMSYADTRATDMLSSGGGTIESSDNYHQQRCVRYTSGAKGCITTVKSVESPMYSYISPSGQSYPSFESYQAAQNGQVTPAAPPVRGRGETAAIVDPVAAKPITGGTTGGEQRLTRDTAASGNNSGGNGNSGSQSAGATNSGKPQQTAATNGGSGSGSNGGGGGSGLASGGSSSGGSNGFSNPYANTNLDLSGKQGNKSQFAGLSDRDTSSMVNEGVSSDGGSSGYDNFGGNGGFGKNNGVRVASSEGVNRDSPISGSSALGGAVTPASAAYSDKNPVMKAKMEDIGSANFQSGFHKANGKEALSPSSLSKTNAMLAKMDKAKRRKIMDQCKGDMSCIASILGVTKSRRSTGGRGIASVEGQQLPKGVWTGYTDILSHMAKVHDKIPINYDGEID